MDVYTLPFRVRHGCFDVAQNACGERIVDENLIAHDYWHLQYNLKTLHNESTLIYTDILSPPKLGMSKNFAVLLASRRLLARLSIALGTSKHFCSLTLLSLTCLGYLFLTVRSFRCRREGLHLALCAHPSPELR
jgi:hypothetical protein